MKPLMEHDRFLHEIKHLNVYIIEGSLGIHDCSEYHWSIRLKRVTTDAFSISASREAHMASAMRHVTHMLCLGQSSQSML